MCPQSIKSFVGLKLAADHGADVVSVIAAVASAKRWTQLAPNKGASWVDGIL
jgi:hypothetical protein